jgi:uncharacterized membrane protein YbhN (UPF0104 family)
MKVKHIGVNTFFDKFAADRKERKKENKKWVIDFIVGFLIESEELDIQYPQALLPRIIFLEVLFLVLIEIIKEILTHWFLLCGVEEVQMDNIIHMV